eukprot:m.139202 g.139202  ORF g.139202 m.139202 type:complete len:469 (-) comp14791_c0_seq8:45-1451(-)
MSDSTSQKMKMIPGKRRRIEASSSVHDWIVHRNWSPVGRVYPSLCGFLDQCDAFSNNTSSTHKNVTCKFSPDKRTIGACTENGSMQFYSLSGKEIASLYCHHNTIFDFTWLQENKVVTASGDQSCRLLHVERATVVMEFRAHTGSVKAVVAHPKNPCLFASASRDGNVCMWDIRCSPVHAASRVARWRTTGPSARLQSHIYPPAQTIKNAHYTHKKSNTKHIHSVTSLAYLHEQTSSLLSGGADGFIHRWDTRRIYSTSKSNPTPCSSMHISRDGISSFSLDDSRTKLVVGCNDSRIHFVRDVHRDTPLLETFVGGASGKFQMRVAMSGDGRYIASTAAERTYVWEIPNQYPMGSPTHTQNFFRKEPWTLSGDGCEVYGVDCCVLDGKPAVVSATANRLRLWTCNMKLPRSQRNNKTTIEFQDDYKECQMQRVQFVPPSDVAPKAKKRRRNVMASVPANTILDFYNRE